MLTNQTITTVAAELAKLGLLGRLADANDYILGLEIVVSNDGSRVIADDDTGEMFAYAGGGTMLFHWARADYNGPGKQRPFALGVGVAVVIKRNGHNTFLALTQTC